MSNKLFLPYHLGSLELKNRIVMAPMTRSRASSDNIPADLMAEYYGQRADAGLIITEGTSPSPNGLGYSNIPGIFNEAQIGGWKTTTQAVHAKGGKIFVQLMHTGRIAHSLNLPKGAEVIAPSAVAAAGQMYTIKEGMQNLPVPRALTTEEVRATIREFVKAAENAIAAGFDGIELHAANGYLIEQFINPQSNIRADEYGGSIEARGRFLIEIIEQAINTIGKDKIGVRFSPYGAFNDMKPYDQVDETYTYLSEQLARLGIAYIHILDHTPGNSSPEIQNVKGMIHTHFPGTLIFCGGFDKERAENELEKGRTELVAFGSSFLANPDLVKRLELDAQLNVPDPSTFYTPGGRGYTDYPFL